MPYFGLERDLVLRDGKRQLLGLPDHLKSSRSAASLLRT